MRTARSTLVRNAAAVLVIAAGCPVALFGGALISCASQGFSADCALSGLAISPLLLVAAGLLAGVLTRGWLGLRILLIGVAIGMITLLAIAELTGHSLPLDPVQVIIAWVWFIAPTTIGYGVARGGARVAAAIGA